jgi:hypothetical protein
VSGLNSDTDVQEQPHVQYVLIGRA